MTTTHSRSATPDDIDARLMRIESDRQQQLTELPASNLDALSASYRGGIEQSLEEVRAARARVRAGRYGVCTGCEEPISPQRLELRPYAAKCAPCAQRD